MTRRTPYTVRGIRRLPCRRCGAPARRQWQICSDKNVYRAICIPCDIALNELVLRWIGDPDWQAKIAAYRVQIEAEEAANAP